MIVGTVVKITDTVTIDGDPNLIPDNVTISIWDSADAKKIDEASMTSKGSNLYEYLYQSDSADLAGQYKYVVSSTYGTYTGRAVKCFQLNAQICESNCS